MSEEQIPQSPASLLYDGPKPEKPEGEPEKTVAPDDEGTPPVDEPEVVEGQEPEGDEVEEVELQTLEELAEHFELDPEWLQKLQVTRKVNGKPVKVSISEALDNLDKVKAADAYLTEAREKAKEIAAEAKQQQEQLTATITAFGKLLETAEAEINADVRAIDWKKLREDDPAEYVAKKDEIRERRERLEKLKSEAAEQYKQAIAQHQEKSLEALKEYVAKERNKLLEAIPDFGDEEKAKSLQKQITTDLKSRGFTDDEIAQAYDSRLVIMAYEAMQYRAAKAKAGAAKKKVVKVPKVLKPGASKSQPKANGRAKDDPVSILYG